MQRLAAEAVEMGAFSLSTGLSVTPSAYATTDEVVALCEAIRPYDGAFYATHARVGNGLHISAIQEAIEIGQRSGVPGTVLPPGHHRLAGLRRRPDDGRHVRQSPRGGAGHHLRHVPLHRCGRWIQPAHPPVGAGRIGRAIHGPPKGPRDQGPRP